MFGFTIVKKKNKIRILFEKLRGKANIDCIVRDIDDEKANSISVDENERRKKLTQYELARAIKKRYEILAEDLVPEEEKVECPECGKEYDGRQGLKTHVTKKHERSDKLSDLFLSEGKIYEEIAESSSFDYKTVERLITVAEIPEQFEPFVKTKRDSKELEE